MQYVKQLDPIRSLNKLVTETAELPSAHFSPLLRISVSVTDV